MKYRIVIRYVGVSLLLVAALMLISALFAFFNGFDDSTLPLIYSAVVTFITGIFPLIFVRPSSIVSVKEGYLIVVTSWLAACVFGMLPYLCYGGEFSFTNALFESISGFTTTGASILTDIESLPLGLKFWRSATAWVGGIGIVTIFSLLVPKGHDGNSVLSGAEISEIAKSQDSRSGRKFILGMLSVYVAMTILCFGSLMITGMPWFDSLTNAMSACSTCGFCIRNNSVASYNNLAAEIVLMFFMVAAGTSFIAIFAALSKRRKRRFWDSEVIRAYAIFLVAGIVLITWNLSRNGEPILDSLRAAAFQVCSITTTTGFATVDTSVWPSLSIVILTIASVVCACSGSTSGGMKMDRVVMLTKQIHLTVQRALNPYYVKSERIDGRVIKESGFSAAMSFVVLYVLLIVINSVINTLAGLDLATGVSASIACIGNVGPGFGSIGSMGNYSQFPELLKYTSMFLMLAGRLEITPLLFVVGILGGSRK